MRSITTILVGLIVICSVLLVARSIVYGYQSQRKIEKVRSKVVLISGESFGGSGRGTGILIDSRHVLTCRHVLEQDVVFFVYTYPIGQVVIAHIERISRSADLGILVLESSVSFISPSVFQS